MQFVAPKTAKGPPGWVVPGTMPQQFSSVKPRGHRSNPKLEFSPASTRARIMDVKRVIQATMSAISVHYCPPGTGDKCSASSFPSPDPRARIIGRHRNRLEAIRFAWPGPLIYMVYKVTRALL